MRIAITGGSGRVGRGVIAMALQRGHEIVSIDRVAPAAEQPGVQFIPADITDYDLFLQALAGCDGLIHLAAIPSPDKYPNHVVHHNNVVGSYNALRAAAEVGIRHVCQASSINAIGVLYSRRAHFDYFPLDEQHPSYAEDPYSLSKWICEIQADSIARRYEEMTIGSLRFHWVVDDRPNLADFPNINHEMLARNLWAYTRLEAAARACLAVLNADYRGHEAFFITAPITVSDEESLTLKERYYPQIPLHGDLSDHRSFFDCRKAEQLLGWQHDLFV